MVVINIFKPTLAELSGLGGGGGGGGGGGRGGGGGWGGPPFDLKLCITVLICFTNVMAGV